MRQQPFGSNGPKVSVIGQGTWYIDRGNRASAVAALRRGIDLGMTHIDTAEMYGDAELVIAEAIAGRRWADACRWESRPRRWGGAGRTTAGTTEGL